MKLVNDEIERTEVILRHDCKKFQLNRKESGRQYYHFYIKRLEKLKNHVVRSCRDKWGQDKTIKPLVDLENDDFDECVIIGTLYKNQELKPNVLKEICDEFSLAPQRRPEKFISETDELVLEDELQRIRLTGKVDIATLVTGIVCGVLGRQDSSGKFIVADICFPLLTDSALRSPKIEEDKYICFISGLNIGCDGMYKTSKTFLEWITGWCGYPKDSDLSFEKIAALYIAGNVYGSNDCKSDSYVVNSRINLNPDDGSCNEDIDSLLCDISSSMNVVLMPGCYDPTNIHLPQQPLHLAMYPKASTNTSFTSVTNPYIGAVDGLRIMGSSGQLVDDIMHNTKYTNPLEVLHKSLSWLHMAPSVPDTLPCYPYLDNDPFIIEEIPDVYFAGNQNKFDFELITIPPKTSQTALISIPSFKKSNSCVLFNLKSFHCTEIKFM